MSEAIFGITGRCCFVLFLPIFVLPIFSLEVCIILMFGGKENDLR